MADQILSAERLRELLSYDPESGVFTWRVDCGARAKIGGIAGYIDSSRGYREIRINGRKYGAQRLAWLYMTGQWPENYVNHKNGDSLDNRWENLRAATAVENGRNRRPSNLSKSGLVGVSWCSTRQKWRAILTLGYFVDKADAGKARDDAAKAVYSEFAPLVR